MPLLSGTFPSPSNASPMLRHTLSARGAATAGVGDRLSALQEDSQLLWADGSGPAPFGGLPASPTVSSSMMSGTPWLQQQQQQLQYAGAGSSSGSSSVFGPRVPSGGGAGCSYLGGLSRDGTESPSRPRRALSAPGGQLHNLAVQHLQQQKQSAAVASACDVGTSSPRYHHPSSLAARVGNHPNYTNIALDVNAAAAGGGLEGQASAGPTPGSACDTPDSQSSPHVSLGSSSGVIKSPAGGRLGMLFCNQLS